MRCCVSGCKNDSRYSSKSQGITYHVFPNEPSLRTRWLEALSKEEAWEPKERSTVCSEHFLCDDMYMTRKGLRKIRAGAVPLIIQDSSNCEFSERITEKVCRICLAMDRKLFPIKNHKFLEEAFEHLTGLSLQMSAEARLPQQLCAECVQRLRNCNSFRVKSLRANSLMIELLKRHEYLTVQGIQSISRENHHLASNLTMKTLIDHFDFYIDEDNRSEENRFNEDRNGNDEIKKEYPIPALSIEVTIKSEDEMPLDKSFNQEDGDTKDDDYSSDDSLPLGLAKAKREEKTKKTTFGRKRKETCKKTKDAPKIDRRRKPFHSDDLNEKLFTITDLTVEEQIADIEKRQESSNFKNAIYKCMECFKGFLDEDAYSSHMSRHTTECGEHRCKICKTHFRHPHALRKHITAHHTQRFSCNQCLYITTHRQSARLHERWHKGTKYKCPHCPDEFVKFTTYMGHIRIKHPSDFVCQVCGFSFVSEKGIMLHMKLKHRQENTVVIPEDGPSCELCNLRFVSAEALRQHINVSARHNTTGKQGRVSNKYKARKSKMGDREKKRRDEEKAEGPIPCEQCGVQLESSRAYHGHFRRMHPDKNRTKYPSMKSPCMCEVCGKMFQSQALLKDHRWVHTGERPFTCDVCGKCFRMKQRLVAHRRVHQDQKPTYGCDLCGKQFSTHSNRQRHMFIHTGLRPFKCEMCGKGFKHSSEKRAHISYVHLKKPWPKRSRGKRKSDGRQLPVVNQQLPPPGASEMEMQPIWNCDPKMDIASAIDDKPYYTLKI